MKRYAYSKGRGALHAILCDNIVRQKNNGWFIYKATGHSGLTYGMDLWNLSKLGS